MMPRRTLSFAGVATLTAVTPLSALRSEVTFGDGRAKTYDFTPHADCPHARDLAGAFFRLARGQRYGSVTRLFYGTRHLLEWLRDARPTAEIEDLTASDIDEMVRDRFGTPRVESRWHGVSAMLQVLRELPKVRFRPEAWDRLQAVDPDNRKPEHTPRDGYDDYVVEQLRQRCIASMEAIYQRLVRDADVLLAAGTDPSGIVPASFGTAGRRRLPHDWTRLENVAVFADRHGPLLPWGVADLLGYPAVHAVHRWVPVQAANEALFPFFADVVPFFTYFLLLTGYTPAEGAALTWDDVRFTSTGVTIQTEKPRARRAVPPQVFMGQNRDTPAGILRMWRSVSVRLTRTTKDNRVFVALRRAGPGAKQSGLTRLPECPWTSTTSGAWMLRGTNPVLCVTNREGQQVTLELARLRKTNWSRRYRDANGDLPQTARDHTPAVAFRHYASTPGLMPVHEATVEAGLRDALSAALGGPRVIADEMGADAEAALAGADDVGLVHCAHVFNGPFSADDEACTEAVFGMCVRCPCAVITARKLPNILVYLNNILRARSEMSPVEWQRRFGEQYHSIRRDILPRLRGAIAAAYATAQADGELPYLAPELLPPATA